MSTNVKLAGYYISIEDEEVAKKEFKAAGFELEEEEESAYVWVNYEDNIGKWIPFMDWKGNYAWVYVLEYEYVCFDICVTFEGGQNITCEYTDPKHGVGNPFAMLYYNGSDMPLLVKNET